MLSIFGFLLMLAPLVIIHEFGHYFFAKIFGVKAEVFSVGFGPKIWSKQVGETEWKVSAIPLGGYVKLLGDEPDKPLPPEEAARSLPRADRWKRFFIFAGGPLFNFLFAIIVYMAIIAIGEPQLASVVGRVEPGTLAEKAGFQSGDRILRVDGVKVTKFEEVLTRIHERPGEQVVFEVMHPESTAASMLNAVPESVSGFSMYGESKHVGEIPGLLPSGRATLVGVSNPQSPAGKLGIKTGAQVQMLQGKEVKTWEQLERVFAGVNVGEKFSLALIDSALKDPKAAPKTFEFTRATKDNFSHNTGLYSSELFIQKVMPGSPAELAGLKEGDRVVKIGGVELGSFFALRDQVQSSGEKDGKVKVEWERDGKHIDATITPTATVSRDPLLKKTTQYTVGIMPMMAMAEPETVIERTLNPFSLAYQGTERMLVFSWRNLVSIGKMFTGEVSMATLGGPILIGKIAGESLARGLISFLNTMAIISIGLGILNILPVPILDGGHIALLGLESIRKRPLSIRQMEIIQQFGLGMIALLMIVVMKNDILRLSIFD